jgi:hypothetical protein
VATHRRRRQRPHPRSLAARPLTQPRDWRVRTKVAAVLVIPALAFLVVAGVQAGLSFRQAAALGEFADQVALGREVTALVHELQFERDLLSGELAAASPGDPDREALRDAVAPAHAAVDEARLAFERAVTPLRDRPALAGLIAEATTALEGLATVRTGVEQGWLRRQAAFDGYTRAIGALLALLPAPSAVDEVQVHGFRELAELKEFSARIRGQVHAVVGAGRFGPGEAERLGDARAQRRAAQDRFRANATPEQLARFDEGVRGQAVRASARLEQAVLEQAGAGAVDVVPQQWWSAATTELEQVREVEAAVLADVVAQVRRDSRDQWRQTLLVSSVALLVLLASLLLSVGIGRSMVRSLRRLRRQAVEVAQVRLPGLLERLRTARGGEAWSEPVPATAAGGADEIGEVAQAFTMVHRSAVHLAVEQAQMRQNVHRIFINVARRSQVLVERQLELLDELERDEGDPARLSHLFQLDHLATRMRRNNDSLLVLTDSDPANRYGRSVPLASVALAAIAEIERYQRVEEDVAAGLRVVGHVVGDLVHLLAELLDNATSFSSPDSTVRLTATRTDGGPPGALIEVTDSGIGMSRSAFRQANALLADPPPIDVATSERMGLVVVGHLAARHQVTVRLSGSDPGVRATVRLPERLLAGADGAEPLPEPPAAGGRSRAVRAEHVLRDPTAGSIWWSRPGDQPGGGTGGDQPGGGTSGGRPAGSTGARLTVPLPAQVGYRPLVPQRVGASGLPVRVPMAQLPVTGLGPADHRAGPDDPDVSIVEPDQRSGAEPDPEEVGRMLSAYYDGVRRAD